jgi:hypothetical protein
MSGGMFGIAVSPNSKSRLDQKSCAARQQPLASDAAQLQQAIRNLLSNVSSFISRTDQCATKRSRRAESRDGTD